MTNAGRSICRSALLFVLMLLGFLTVPAVQADEAVLRPGYISGRIQIGSETIQSVQVRAYWSIYSAVLNLSPNTNSVSYSITVNVPEGTQPIYDVRVTAYSSSGAYLDLGSKTVGVAAFATSTLDFLVDPGYIDGTINVTGGVLQSASIFAIRSSSSAYTYTNLSVGSSGSFHLPVAPNTDIQISGTAYVEGLSYPLSTAPVTVAAQQTANVNFTITHSGGGGGSATGNIAGTFQVNGPRPFFDSAVEVLNPPYRGVSLYANGPYLFSSLNAGTYYMNARSRFERNTTYPFSSDLTYPDSSFSPGRNTTVVAGQTTNVNILANEAFIAGKLRVTGASTVADLYSAGVTFYGTDDAARGGKSNAGANRDGSYLAVATLGAWAPRGISLYFVNPNAANYLSESLQLYDYRLDLDPIVVAETSTTATYDLTYPIGSVTVNFRVLGGSLLSYPRLIGDCTLATPTRTLTQSIRSWGDPQVNVPAGQVTFVATEGTCLLEASANVGGSTTLFGRVSVTIVPGAEQIVDLTGPVLTVIFPSPGYRTSNGNITVAGRVTDDVQVTSVSVNGVSATLTPSGNPTDAHEQNFSATIDLARGPNEVKTIATDSAGNRATDARTIYRDEGPPTLDWTPPEGATLHSTVPIEVAVEGIATDDAGVQGVTVNAQSVTLIPAATASDLNRVHFSGTVTLQVGDNFITVVATDISNRMTTETHKITVVPNLPPSVTLTGPTNANEGATVTFSFNVTDPDGDPFSVQGEYPHCGTGGSLVAGSLTTTNSGGNFQCVFQDGPGTSTVSMQVADMLSTVSNVATTLVTILNVGPTVTQVTGPVDPLALGSTASVNVAFTDPGILDTHTCTFSWDDGLQNVVQAMGTGNGKCTATHTYAQAGVYTVTVTVTDNYGANASGIFEYIVVFDPSSGFVTGGGFIDSPPGAYRPDTTLVGKANFGFNAQYKKGANIPTGQTEFQFQVATFNFHSSDYQYLVVAGPKAQFKGTGTVNGLFGSQNANGYGFILTATDGQQSGGGGSDKFRIKIIDKDTGQLVYDNALGATDDIDNANPQIISGGSIVIHK